MQGQVNSREPIYSTQYSCEKIPADWLAAWEAAAEPALHLPKANPFIPTEFQLLQARVRLSRLSHEHRALGAVQGSLSAL